MDILRFFQCRDRQDSKSVRWIIALLCIFTLTGLILNIHWISEDKRPTAYDDSWYLENAFNLYHRLTKDGLVTFLQAYLTTFRVKAPLIAVLPLPFFLAFGPTLDAALLVNCVFLAMINIYLFLLGRELFSPLTGLLAVVIFQTMPITIGMSRAFMTEYGLAAFVIAFVYYLVKSVHFRVRAATIKLGVVTGLGLLMKINFLIVAGPLLVVLAGRHWEDGLAAAGRRLGSATGIAALIAGPLYLLNGPHILAFTWNVRMGQMEHYQVANRLAWLGNAGSVALSPYYSWGFMILGLALLLSSVRPKLGPPSKRSLFLLSWFLRGAFLALLGGQADYRHILVLLPPPAIALAEATRRVSLSVLPSKLLALMLPLLLALPMLGYAALGNQAAWLSRLRRPAGWARLPDDHGAWGQKLIIEDVQGLVVKGARTSNVVVGVEHPFFNSTLFNCLDARIDGPLKFHSLAFEPDVPSALAKVRKLNPDVIILADGFSETELQEFLNRPNESLREALISGELQYRRTSKIRLTSDAAAVLYSKNQEGDEI